MTRDIVDRLSLFADCEVWVERVALNMDQVERYKPPPNPAKLSDSRAVGYISIHGRSSWELDALEPRVLATIVEDEVLNHRDDELWNFYMEKQESERAILRKATDEVKGMME